MVEALKIECSPNKNKKIFILEKNVPTYKLSDFINVNTKKFFVRYDISLNFLNSDPSSWENNNDYKQAFQIVKTLKVDNDVAERGVALAEKYNSSLTFNETQKQYLYQSVKQHIKNFPNCSKNVLINQV